MKLVLDPQGNLHGFIEGQRIFRGHWDPPNADNESSFVLDPPYTLYTPLETYPSEDKGRSLCSTLSTQQSILRNWFYHPKPRTVWDARGLGLVNDQNWRPYKPSITPEYIRPLIISPRYWALLKGIVSFSDPKEWARLGSAQHLDWDEATYGPRV